MKKIICKINFADLVLEGSEYEVIEELKNSYRIINEKGVERIYSKSLFKNKIKYETFGEDVMEGCGSVEV